MASGSWQEMVAGYDDSGRGDLWVGPADRYQLRVVSCKGRETDIQPTFEIVGGPYAGKRLMAGVISIKGGAEKNFWVIMKQGFGLGKEYFAALNAPSVKAAMEAVAAQVVGTILEVNLQLEGPNEHHDDDRMTTGFPNHAKWALIQAPAAAGVPAAAPAAVPPAAPAAVAAPVAAAPVAEAVAPAPVAAVTEAAPVAAPVAPVAPAPVAVAAPVVAEAPAVAPVAPLPVAAAVTAVDEPNF